MPLELAISGNIKAGIHYHQVVINDLNTYPNMFHIIQYYCPLLLNKGRKWGDF